MKNKFFFVIAFFALNIINADAGFAYRFHISIISEKGETINGYFYHYSYDEYDNDNAFKDYIKKDTINLYTNIQTLNIGNTIIDFSTSNYKKPIDLKNFGDVRVNEYLNFAIGDRLIDLTSSEFNLIKTQQPQSQILYNEKVAENCIYLLLTWNNDKDLSNHYKEINEKLIFLGENVVQNQYEFYDYLKLKKEKLQDDGILLINYCSAL